MEIDSVIAGLHLVTSLKTFLYLAAGLALGVVLGAIPGVTSLLGMGVLLPYTAYLSPVDAVVFLTAMFTGGVYGGGITAILLNVPGSPAAVCTSFDGYPLTRAGKQNEALGLQLGASVLGSFGGYVLALFALKYMGQVVLRFGPPEMVLVSLFALVVIGAVWGNLLNSLIAGAFGLMLGTIGATPFGRPRGNFGLIELYDGLPVVAVMVGLLALSELFTLVRREYITQEGVTAQRELRLIVKGFLQTFQQPYNLLRSTLLGYGVGVLPAVGATAAAVLSYGQARKASRDPEAFGKGSVEGLVAAETANNAAEGGSVGVMMSFGIPGGAAAALLMAAFMLHGLSPGPYLLRDHADMAYAVIWANLAQAIVLIPIAVLFIYYVSKIVFVPTRIIVPAVAMLAVFGAISHRGVTLDVGILILFGILGYVLTWLGYPLISLLVGFLLAGGLDGDLLRTYLLFEGRFGALLQRPVFVTMLAIMVLSSVIRPLINRYRNAARVAPTVHG